MPPYVLAGGAVVVGATGWNELSLEAATGATDAEGDWPLALL